MPPSVAGENGGQVCLGFQWDAAAWDQVSFLWGSLFDWLGERKVHWNLPALPADTPARKRASLVKALRVRIESRGDAVTAMGYSGAPHPLLNIDELDREVSWGLKNPWGTGIIDLLGIRPRILVPRVPDLARPGAWKVYGDRGFRLIGIVPEAGDRPPVAPAGCIAFVRIGAASLQPGRPEARRLRRLLASSSGIFLLVDLTGFFELIELRAFLDGPKEVSGGSQNAVSVRKHRGFVGRATRLMPLTGPGELPLKVTAHFQRLDWTSFSVPGLHATLDETAGLSRKKRKKMEEYCSLLGRLGSTAGDAVRAEPERTDPRREFRLVAHMLGEVVLAGNLFDVQLHGGRFCGITREGKDLMPPRPAVSFLRVGGSLHIFKTSSSFSFESDHGTGLREELGMDGMEGSLVRIEYSFRDDSPFLSIDMEVQFPEIPQGARVDEYAPFAFALRSLKKGESANVEVFAPDGSSSSVEVSEGAGSVLAPGARHRIRRLDGGWVVLQFQSPGGRAWGLPSFTVTRARGGRLLMANPFGSSTPLPGSCLGGRRARFSLRLGLEDA